MFLSSIAENYMPEGEEKHVLIINFFRSLPHENIVFLKKMLANMSLYLFSGSSTAPLPGLSFSLSSNIKPYSSGSR